MSGYVDLSVIVPCFNEDEGLLEFHRRITASCAETGAASVPFSAAQFLHRETAICAMIKARAPRLAKATILHSFLFIKSSKVILEKPEIVFVAYANAIATIDRTFRADYCGAQPAGLLSLYAIRPGNWCAARLRCHCSNALPLAPLLLLRPLSKICTSK
jgi:hypothetical protein